MSLADEIARATASIRADGRASLISTGDLLDRCSEGRCTLVSRWEFAGRRLCAPHTAAALRETPR